MAAGPGFDVFRDDWGIPHLRAGSADALAHAQGFAAAGDRAWQIEVERHRVQGTTAAFLGPEALGWDRFARQARLADTARRCFARLEPETAAWVTSYVGGVNAGLAEGARRAPEFTTTGLTPGVWEPWTPLGVWLSVHILFAGFPTKLWREEVARRLGEDAVTLFATDGPGTSGSNGWLLTADRTRTGAALVAGDPHRFIEDPGVYQQIRLACPEFDVVGLAVPGVPGLAHFGHTGGVAWAITNAMADYQDLYRERLRRTADGEGVEALGPGGWERADVHTVTIEVAGGDPVTVETVETARGPVIIGGPDPGSPDEEAIEPYEGAIEPYEGAIGPYEGAISLRHPPRVTGDLGFDALPALLRARTVADLDTALDRWVEPVNVVLAADTTGATLHRVAGHVPSRPRTNSLRVVPAHDPAYAWRDRPAPMPRAVVDGTAVMANARGLAAPLGVEFAPPHRAERIRELLDRGEDWTVKGMADIHTDTRLASAGPLLDLLAEVRPDAPDAVRLRDRLLHWDRHMAADSTDATLYSALRTEVVHRLAAHPALAPLTGAADPARSPAHPALFAPWLAAVPRIGYALEHLLTGAFLPYEDRLAAVAGAVATVAPRYAGDPPRPWGEVHRLAPWRALPDTGEVRPGLAGDHDCVLSTSGVPGVTDLCARGPAARFVWDLARREDSLWVVPFGASGVPSDTHHHDQLPLWLRGELVPVVTDWALLHRSEETTTPMPALRTPVHEQEVDGFGTVRLVPIDPEADAALIHGWVGEERARFWGMHGASRDEVREIYAHLDSLTTHHGYLALRDGVPVALFQTYDPATDPIGECYDVRPGDFGVHLLMAPGDTALPGFTAGLLTALVTFVFSDPAHLRVVAEPDADNEKAVARMVRAGFVLGPVVDKPEKRARLAFLSRPVLPRQRSHSPGTAGW
ncbi:MULTISPECIES: GNAT family N-acetyltransferase [Streptomyces]|uniref:Lysine N-acyltransferase MbtK n=1 Tax=Streptomyces clavifer TaxID=68188 RepID=A0ABS4VA25_9ACTN|nr:MULTISPECIES: GNAT family N-acetyltransferase [Streptomyces]MBP2360760.1 penicillin amidase [Streptomyces clavifer]MDX2746065.1 GNAT family N-acetyltransferase [Streptomyces sp. NRRL_B-2557]GHB11897.1 antibiotic transporter [Streptomyces clavifer]